MHSYIHPSATDGYVLSLRDILLEMRLGVPKAERAAPQKVAIHVDLIFYAAPQGCDSDAVADTLCYDELTQILKDCCLNDEFCLIERAAKVLYTEIKAHIGDAARVILQIVKLAPPVPEIHGGAAFTYGDVT